MSHWVDLTAADQHRFSCYIAEPEGTPRGAVVVLQEIFGVNSHIRSVCDRLAASGYVAGAPALFDRVSKGFEAQYDGVSVDRGRDLVSQLDMQQTVADITATMEHLEPHGKVSVIGFCFGGSLAYKMATVKPTPACAVSYYGRLVPDMADESPLCPVILHFGEYDGMIPLEGIERVQQKQPDIPVYLYPAGHGFNCDQRADYEPESARLAWERTMALIDEVSAR